MGTAHPHGAFQSYLGLPVTGLFQLLGHLFASALREGGQSSLHLEEPLAEIRSSGSTNVLCNHGGMACPLWASVSPSA